jgi:hypothetical protein
MPAARSSTDSRAWHWHGHGSGDFTASTTVAGTNRW